MTQHREEPRSQLVRCVQRTRTPLSTTADFNHSLNGFRGFCALLVFAFHSGNAGVISTIELGVVSDFLWTSLRYGVEMFFMISGYVILSSQRRQRSLAAFLKGRFIRIYPAWVPALMCVSIVCATFNAKMFTDVSTSDRIGLFFANLVLLPPLVTLPLIHRGSWSLSYEWVFYIAIAAGVFVQRHLRWAKGAYLVLSASFICFFPRATFFVTGILVFMLNSWFAQRRQWLQWPLASMAIFLVAWRFTEADEAALSLTYLDFIADHRWIAAIAAFLAALHMFASLVHRCSRQLRFLENRFFQFYGDISYSFYLWHALVMSAVKRVITPYLVPQIGLALSFLLFVTVSGAIATAISWVSFRLFETRTAKAPEPTDAETLPTRPPLSRAAG